MEFLQPRICASLKGKCLDVVMDLYLDHHCVIFSVLWGTNHSDGRKLFVAIQGGISPGGSRFLKSSQISVGHKSATDIVAEAINITCLILDGERDSSRKGPLQKSIIFSLHYANKKGNVSSVSTISSFWEDAHEELVSTQTSVNRRTIKWCFYSITITQEELRETLNLPSIISTTDLTFS